DPALDGKSAVPVLESKGAPRLPGTWEERRDFIAAAVKARFDGGHTMVLGTTDDHVVASRLLLDDEGAPAEIESYRIDYTIRGGRRQRRRRRRRRRQGRGHREGGTGQRRSQGARPGRPARPIRSRGVAARGCTGRVTQPPGKVVMSTKRAPKSNDPTVTEGVGPEADDETKARLAEA